MPDDYTSATGGSLKLKGGPGVKDSKIDKKKKKKKTKPVETKEPERTDFPQLSLSPHSSQAHANMTNPTSRAAATTSPTPLSTLIALTQAYAEQYMSQPQFDASHDYRHIERVWALARLILTRERALSPSTPYSAEIVTLAALLHDVGDRKYYVPPANGSEGAALPPAQDFLLRSGASAELAERVQTIITHVSYSTEMKTSPERMAELLKTHPELGIVQDADRLDAMGAVGVGRCFAFCGARSAPSGPKDSVQGNAGLEGAVGHFEEKLERLVGFLKTRSGRELGAKRAERLKTFRGWWQEEMGEAMMGET
ncbi:MAG: hypothetical protein M4579_006949 [Chaenotheca gracillima]|nr:MAG: hypothetical protein M4579_006949 [Chaenotheca gracillima]